MSETETPEIHPETIQEALQPIVVNVPNENNVFAFLGPVTLFAIIGGGWWWFFLREDNAFFGLSSNYALLFIFGILAVMAGLWNCVTSLRLDKRNKVTVSTLLDAQSERNVFWVEGVAQRAAETAAARAVAQLAEHWDAGIEEAKRDFSERLGQMGLHRSDIIKDAVAEAFRKLEDGIRHLRGLPAAPASAEEAPAPEPTPVVEPEPEPEPVHAHPHDGADSIRPAPAPDAPTPVDAAAADDVLELTDPVEPVEAVAPEAAADTVEPGLAPGEDEHLFVPATETAAEPTPVVEPAAAPEADHPVEDAAPAAESAPWSPRPAAEDLRVSAANPNGDADIAEPVHGDGAEPFAPHPHSTADAEHETRR